MVGDTQLYQPNLAGSFAGGVQAGQQQQAQQQELAKRQQDLDDERKIKGALSGSIGPDGKLNWDAFAQNMTKAGVNPEKIQKFQAANDDHVYKLASSDKLNLDNNLNEIDSIRGLMMPIAKAPAEQRPFVWQTQRNEAIRMLPKYKDKIPEQYPGDEAFNDLYGHAALGSAQVEEALKLRVQKGFEDNLKSKTVTTAQGEFGFNPETGNYDRFQGQAAPKQDMNVSEFEAWQKQNPGGKVEDYLRLAHPKQYIQNGSDNPNRLLTPAELQLYNKPAGTRFQDVIGQTPQKAAAPPSEGERSAFSFYKRATDANKVLNELEPKIAGMGIVGQVGRAALPNVMQSDDNQVYTQAQRQFTQAKLRRESGAAISQSEYDQDAKTYFPQPGDSQKVLTRKAAGRKAIINELKTAAGRAYSETYGDSGVPKGYVRIQASDGSVHDLPRQNLRTAQERDPGLQVLE